MVSITNLRLWFFRDFDVSFTNEYKKEYTRCLIFLSLIFAEHFTYVKNKNLLSKIC